MATTIHIRRTGKNPGGTIPVGINGVVSQVPVGVDVTVGDDVLEALVRHGVDYRLASVPRVTAGYSVIPGTGKGVEIGINGVVGELPIDAEFQPTTAQQDVIDHSAVSQVILTGLPGGPPILVTLTLSGSLQIGTFASGAIIGATVGSTIVSNIPGITVNSGARTYSGTPTGSAATIANGLVETLAGATNTPRNSSVDVAASTDAPTGFTYFMDPDGARLTDADGAYLMEAA